MTNYVFIGDVHSQYSKFSAAVQWVKNNVEDFHIIQGGDLFDSRTTESDSVGVYELVKSLGSKITVLQSNHLWKMYRVLNDPTLEYMPSMQRTFDDFDLQNNEALRIELKNWISQMPYGVAIKDPNGQEYRACHAYWSSKLYVPATYDEMYRISIVSAKARQKMLYGIYKRGSDKDRLLWWNENYSNEYIRVAFHYHTVSIDPYGVKGCKHLVLDGSCGDDGGNLMVYDVSRRLCASM